MNFDTAVEYLYSLGNEVETMKLGVGNITTLLQALSEPQIKYKKVQVAGTNGKGSVCAFLDSICREAGVRTGLYTSPHLISITERIKIDGVDIAEDEFARFATRVRETAELLASEGKLTYRPTFFEQITAIGLLAFAEHNVEIAILETGLGGRLDAVTAARAEIAAITRIDLDHQEYLGETIEEIAAEKAAIIREDTEVVLVHQAETVERELIGRCREVGVGPHWASADIRIKEEPAIAPVLSGTIATERANYGPLELRNMRGRHQFENAAAAIAVAERLIDQGFKLSTEQITLGVEKAVHPGRLEDLPPNFLFDGAHNPAGARALKAYLAEFYSGRHVTLVFGAMRDKAVSEIASILWPMADRLVLTKPSNSRALTADELTREGREFVGDAAPIKTGTAAGAIGEARASTPPEGLIVITGSLYLVGEARKLLNNT